MADWERRLEEEARSTRDELGRRCMQGDPDRGMGFFNVARSFIGQYVILLIILIAVMIGLAAVFVLTRFSVAELRDSYLEQRALVRSEQEAQDTDPAR